jgi:hypothetical protein
MKAMRVPGGQKDGTSACVMSLVQSEPAFGYSHELPTLPITIPYNAHRTHHWETQKKTLA